MEKKLQILIIEDDPADALRLIHELGRAGFAFRCQRVETKEGFLNAVQQRPDLILSDHGLPSFSGFAALDIVQKQCPEVPFIFVTGSYDQGSMVEMFESGAAGYVYKNHLSDLKPAIEQALKDSTNRATRPPVQLSQEWATTPERPVPEPKPKREQVLLCSRCKKVLNSQGLWEEIDLYLRRNQQATVTLALCPVCATARYPGLQL